LQVSLPVMVSDFFLQGDFVVGVQDDLSVYQKVGEGSETNSVDYQFAEYHLHGCKVTASIRLHPASFHQDSADILCGEVWLVPPSR
jgi:hypothetical protein